MKRMHTLTELLVEASLLTRIGIRVHLHGTRRGHVKCSIQTHVEQRVRVRCGACTSEALACLEYHFLACLYMLFKFSSEISAPARSALFVSVSQATFAARQAASTGALMCDGTLFGSVGGGGAKPGKDCCTSTNALTESGKPGESLQYPITESMVNTRTTGGKDTNAGGLGMWRLALGSPCSRTRAFVEVELTFLISLCMPALDDERACFPAYMRERQSRETATDSSYCS